MKIMASGPIASQQIDRGTMETVTDFIFLGSKISADADYSHEIKMLAPWKKSYDKPRQHIKKHFLMLFMTLSYFMTLSTKVRLVKAMVFPVVIDRCESWTIMKAVCQRSDAFELWFGEDS